MTLNSSLRNILSPTVATVIFIAAGFATSSHAQSLNENFNNNVLPPSLQLTTSAPDFIGGQVVFSSGDRRYLRTVANYNTTNFVAEVTVRVQPVGPEGIAFIGIGPGIPNYNFYAEPMTAPTAYARFVPDAFGHTVEISRTLSATNSIQEHINTSYQGGDGLYRVRIVWNAAVKNLSFVFQKNYVRGPLVPTGTVSATVDEPFDSTTTGLYFGGEGGATFDDLVVIALAGTPGATDCHGKSVSALVSQYGNLSSAAVSLGSHPSNLQALITGFCGN